MPAAERPEIVFGLTPTALANLQPGSRAIDAGFSHLKSWQAFIDRMGKLECEYLLTEGKALFLRLFCCVAPNNILSYDNRL